MIEKNKESASVVVDLKLGSHGFLHSADQAAGQNNIVDRVAFKFADVIRPGLGVHHHSNSDRRENFSFPGLLVIATAKTFAHSWGWCPACIHLLRVEKATWTKI